MQDTFLSESPQVEIYLLLVEFCLFRYQSLVDINIVGKQTTITAQQCRNHAIFMRRQVVKSIQLIALQQKHHPCLGFWICVIIDVASIGKYLQGRIHHHREMLKRMTKQIDVKLERISHATSHTYLKEIGKVVVHLNYIVFFGIVVYDSLIQLPVVAIIIQQYGV